MNTREKLRKKPREMMEMTKGNDTTEGKGNGLVHTCPKSTDKDPGITDRATKVVKQKWLTTEVAKHTVLATKVANDTVPKGYSEHAAY